MRAGLITSCTLAFAFVALGCQGNGGAVSVRWRIVDQSTGDEYDPGDAHLKARDGSCCLCRDPTTNACATTSVCSNSWQIETVSIRLDDAVTGAPMPVNVAPFPCSIREKTTAFVLPTGTFAISIGATNVLGDGMNVPVPVAVPPPSVRTIVKGDVVNLDVIEIGVDPLPLPR